MIQPPAVLDRIDTEVGERLDALAAGLAANGRTIKTRIRYGRPASEIVLEADRFGADLRRKIAGVCDRRREKNRCREDEPTDEREHET